MKWSLGHGGVSETSSASGSWSRGSCCWSIRLWIEECDCDLLCFWYSSDITLAPWRSGCSSRHHLRIVS
jgi:hypothetical protein